MQGCNNYSWDPASAMRKAASDISVSLSAGPVSVTKQLTGPNNDQKDAFRNCSNCGSHVNFHKK